MNAIVKGLQNYKQVHFEECKYIWKNLVPRNGQADYLQGELLRQVEKLRNEACDNGNVNWDDNYEWFCDFLKETLLGSKLFSEEESQKIEGVLTFIKENGNYARSVSAGKIAEDEMDFSKLAYVQDDLYDYLADVVAMFYLAHKEPISYDKKEYIYR